MSEIITQWKQDILYRNILRTFRWHHPPHFVCTRWTEYKKIKDKIVPAYAMKARRGSRNKTALILYLVAGRRSLVNITPRPLHPQLNRRLSFSQSRSGLLETKKFPFSCRDTNLGPSSPWLVGLKAYFKFIKIHINCETAQSQSIM